ncbi:MAG: hypothetical protein KAU28_00350 [Phycisphaerae bacterium]|nr:hypothetical protein [Phycisphaerae bacterium]
MNFQKCALSGVCLVVVLSGTITAEEASKKSIAQLRREADKILKLSNVTARTEVDVVFQLAERLVKARRTKDALKYYVAGLELQPWAMKHQLAYAQFLTKHGNKTLAKERAELIINYSEQDSLRVQAMELLGQKANLTIPEISKLPGDGPALVLVPFGEIQILLVKDIAKALEKELDIPVITQNANLKLPPPKRDPLKQFTQRLRESVMKCEGEALFEQILNEENLEIENLQKDENLLRFYKAILAETADESAVEKFLSTIAMLKKRPKQWPADKLINLLKNTAKPYARRHVGYLGITEKDIYAKDYNFLFGWASRGWAVMSYRRFMADFNNELPNRKRLLKRAYMQCLASAGHVFNVKRCSDPRCARAYPHCLSEHDAKSGKLCNQCKKGFKKAFENTREASTGSDL